MSPLVAELKSDSQGAGGGPGVSELSGGEGVRLRSVQGC